MKTLFGIRSNGVIIAVGCFYLSISLHTSLHELRYFRDYNSVDDHPHGYLLIDTNSVSFHIIALFLSLSCLLSSMLLVLGVVEKRYKIIRPWLVFNFLLVCIFGSIFFCLLTLFVEVLKSSWFNACGFLIAIFCVSIATVCHIYLWNRFYSLYRKLQKQSLRLYRVPDNLDRARSHTV